jgi:hypothetical protein
MEKDDTGGERPSFCTHFKFWDFVRIKSSSSEDSSVLTYMLIFPGGITEQAEVPVGGNRLL